MAVAVSSGGHAVEWLGACDGLEMLVTRPLACLYVHRVAGLAVTRSDSKSSTVIVMLDRERKEC